jgi:hypothetical protein
MGCFGGGKSETTTTVKAPEKTSTERAIDEYTLQNMFKTEGLTDALLPYYLSELGYRGVETPTTAQDREHFDTDKYVSWVKSTPTTVNAKGKAVKLNIGAGDKTLTTDPWAHYQKYVQGKGYADGGYWDTTDTTYEKLTDDEMYAAMSGLEKSQYDVSKAQAERTLKALKGELPISPALEKSLTSKETQLAEYLNRIVGPNWRQSTAGQQMIDLMESNELIREEARRGEISQGEANLLNQLGFQTNKTTADTQNLNAATKAYLPIISGYNSIIPNYQNKGSTTTTTQSGGGGAESLLGTLLGGAMRIGGSAFAASGGLSGYGDYGRPF